VPIGYENDQIVIVRYPVKIVSLYDPNSNETMFAFYPWNPYTSQELIAVNKSAIIAITTVRETVKPFYLKRVLAMKAGEHEATSMEDAMAAEDAIPESQDGLEAPPEESEEHGSPIRKEKVWIN